MTTTTQTTDPRPLYDGALAWALGLVRGVRTDQLTLPTPCSEFDVRALLAHLVATPQRAAAVGRGEDPFSVPSSAPQPPGDDWAGAYAEAVDAGDPVEVSPVPAPLPIERRYDETT